MRVCASRCVKTIVTSSTGTFWKDMGILVDAGQNVDLELDAAFYSRSWRAAHEYGRWAMDAENNSFPLLVIATQSLPSFPLSANL